MEYNEYRKKVEALNAEIRELGKRYIDELPFHADDKIKVKGVFVGWILSVKPLSCDKVWLCVDAPKKNGERSKSSRQISVKINEIEVVND